MTNETIKHIATVFPIDPDALKPNPKLRRRVSIIKEFSLNTSANGIPSIARSENIPNRIFWIIATLIFTGIMIYFVVESILAYFAYPSQTSVSIIVEWPQAFPAVTICNYSPIRYDRFIGPFLNYTNALNLTNTTDTTHFDSTQANYIYSFLVDKLNRGESLNDFFFSLESMMMYCNYNGLPCTVANFTSFVSPSYGLCYTYNAKLKNATDGDVKNSGDNGGTGLFQLQLYAYQHQYVPYMLNAIGMIVMVHDNVQLPYVDTVGMQLAPGRHHKLGYTKKNSQFLPAPYTTCNDKLDPGMQAMYDHYQGADYEYSQFLCYITCIQAYTYKKCGCGNPFRWAASSVVLPGTTEAINITFCDINNPCYVGAASELMNTYSIWSIYCPDCTQECSFSDFIIQSSSLLAPPAFLLDSIKQFVEASTIPLPQNWTTSWVSEIQSSYVSLEVAYQTTRTDVYSQQATLGPVDVLSNVGGQTGLWIGISFLSLMEIVEMIFRLVRYQWYSTQKTVKKRFRRRQNTDEFF